MSRSATVARWTLGLGALLVATLTMLLVRGALDKAHVALVYLLVVLGASAWGGRTLGLTISALAFLGFDFFFLKPYLTFVIANPLDWIVLVVFLVTSVVAAQLLYRERATAERATQRAIEVDRLAALGAESLNAADADEALRAIADVIRTSVSASECDIFLRAADGSLQRVAGHNDDAAKTGSLVEWIVTRGSSAVELTDGTVRVAHELPPARDVLAGQHWEEQPETAAAVGAVTRSEDRSFPGRIRAMFTGDAGLRDRPAVRALALPLRVRDTTVGVLRLASVEPMTFTPEEARVLVALAYYAALGVERARLVAAAERSESERRVESLRSALLTAVSHDLRTPLTTIKGVANELLHGADAKRAAVIESEADRLNTLVGDLLELSRIHANAVNPALAINTADDLLDAALRSAQGMLGGRRVEVDMPREELLAGMFDLTPTLRILVNLLDNAAKYSPGGTPIDVRVRREGGRLRIEVMDRGPGVPENERSRIFDPFYRPPNVPADVAGYGLGLSIARGLAEAQSGSVEFSPRPGGGSTFTLDLPSADIPAVEAEPQASASSR